MMSRKEDIDLSASWTVWPAEIEVDVVLPPQPRRNRRVVAGIHDSGVRRYRWMCHAGHWIIGDTDLTGLPCPVSQCGLTLPPPDTDLDARIRNQRREITRLHAKVAALHRPPNLGGAP